MMWLIALSSIEAGLDSKKVLYLFKSLGISYLKDTNVLGVQIVRIFLKLD